MATSPPKKDDDFRLFVSNALQQLKDAKPLLKMPKLPAGKAEGIPLRYQGRPPDQIFDNAEFLFMLATEYLMGVNPGWPGGILHGALGRGKTAACCEALKIFGIHGRAGLFVILYDMITEIKETWNEGADELRERHALAKFTTPALLVVDEIGIQFSTVAERNLLYKVVVTRYNGNLPTLLTTNINLNGTAGMNEFYKSAGDKVASRFDGFRYDCSGWGQSLRGK